MRTEPRTPLWHKSMARFLAGPANSGAEPTKNLSRAIDDTILARLGLKIPPTDPSLLGSFLTADDAADAASDADEFTRGIRRAVRLSLARSAGLHRLARQPWKAWVEANFHIGYACFHRYHAAAELQIGLIARVPPVAHERAPEPFDRTLPAT